MAHTVPKETQEDLEQTVAHIARALNEEEEQPVSTIRQVVTKFGAEFALKTLDDTLKVEEEGGMLVHDGTRKRTPGGVFFYLVRGRIPHKDTVALFHEPPFKWKDRLPILEELKPHPGVVKVKVTLIGRPGKVVEKRYFTITMMNDMTMPTLPKGLPSMPENPTSYMVYISRKQWKRVKEAIKNPDDILIIQGFARYDPELEGMAVFATSTMTKFLQQQRQGHNQQSGSATMTNNDESRRTPGIGNGTTHARHRL